MKYKDLRDFIRFLEQKGDLKRIATPVSCELEIAEICDRVVKQGGPALLFENVEGYDIPVLINMYGTEQRMAWALGVEKLDDLVGRISELLGMVQGAPEGIMEKLRTVGQLARIASYQPRSVGSAPCQEVVHTGASIDLNSFPILKCWPLDAGRYITLPMVITKDPDTGSRNVGMYRIQVYDSRTAAMHWQTHKVGTSHLRSGARQGLERLEVAVALGGDPASIWTGSAPLPPGMDEIMVAGFLREEGVEMVKARSVDLEVPAHQASRREDVQAHIQGWKIGVVHFRRPAAPRRGAQAPCAMPGTMRRQASRRRNPPQPPSTGPPPEQRQRPAFPACGATQRHHR